MPLVSADAAAFARLLTNLGPSGDAWPGEPDSVYQQDLLALAVSFTTLNDRANYLVTDGFPATTLELLPQWEASLGLPDACTPPGILTIDTRVRNVVAKLLARGGQSVPYFVGIASSLGATVTVEQFFAFRADANSADDPDNDDVWDFAWKVQIAAASTIPPYGPLSADQIATIECRLRSLMPAQGFIIFDYGVTVT